MLKLEVHVPERLRLLLEPGEVLPSDALSMADNYQAIAAKKHRIARGAYMKSGKVFIFGGDGDVENSTELDAMSFLQSEFPGLISDWGGVLEDGLTPVEIVVTPRNAAALFEKKVPKLGRRSFLVVRQGMAEVSFETDVWTGAVGSTLSAVEDASAKAKGWLAPVCREIIDAALFGR
jgi:hypothetical protein